jgi:aminoacrylate peracid reductase
VPREEVNPGWDFERYTFSPAVRHGNRIYVSGMTATNEGGELVAPGDIVGQCRYILEKLRTVLEAAGASLDDVVMTREYITTTENYKATAQVRRELFSQPYPAAVGVIVAGLLGRGALIEIEAVAELTE